MAGSQRSCTAKMRMRMMPNQKLGMLTPTKAITLAM